MTAALAAAAALWLAGCGGPGERAGMVTVYAAASLGPALEEIVGLHRDRTGEPVTAAFASSSVLAKQIDAGAEADLFVSADPAWTGWLAERGHLEPGRGFDLAENSLVIVAPAGEVFAFDPAAGRPLADAFRGRLALGDPDHVPAGVYAREALQHAGWWDALAPRVLGAADVRAALALVERRECEAGIVYASDAAGSGRVRVVAPIPDGWHEPIVYPVAVVAGHSRPELDRFLDTLRSPEAARILVAHGFRLPRAAPVAGAP